MGGVFLLLAGIAVMLLFTGFVFHLVANGKQALPGIVLHLILLGLEVKLAFWVADEFASPGFMGVLKGLDKVSIVMGGIVLHMLLFCAWGIWQLMRKKEENPAETAPDAPGNE